MLAVVNIRLMPVSVDTGVIDVAIKIKTSSIHRYTGFLADNILDDDSSYQNDNGSEDYYKPNIVHIKFKV